MGFTSVGSRPRWGVGWRAWVLSLELNVCFLLRLALSLRRRRKVYCAFCRVELRVGTYSMNPGTPALNKLSSPACIARMYRMERCQHHFDPHGIQTVRVNTTIWRLNPGAIVIQFLFSKLYSSDVYTLPNCTEWPQRNSRMLRAIKRFSLAFHCGRCSLFLLRTVLSNDQALV